MSSKICRICMTTFDFHEDVIDADIFEKVKVCLKLEIDPDDKCIPSTICLKCTNKVREFFQFRKQCWKVQRMFLEKLSQKNTRLVKFTNAKLSEYKGTVHGLRRSSLKSVSAMEKGIWMNKRRRKEMTIRITEVPAPPAPSRKPPQPPEMAQTEKEFIEKENEQIGELEQHSEPEELLYETQPEYIPETAPGSIEALEIEDSNSSPNSIPDGSVEPPAPVVEEKAIVPKNVVTVAKRKNKMSGKELYRSLLEPCGMCDKMVERNRLEGHRNRHLGVRPYDCPVESCNNSFYCKHARRLHVRCRHGTESYQCDICGKVYKARRDLLGHKRESHGEAKFKCDECPKKFTTRSRLKQHMCYHTGERNFPCTVCDMRFFSNFQLKVHIRTHTQSYPFVCLVCRKKFRYRHMAKDHITQDHGIDLSLHLVWIKQYLDPEPEEVGVDASNTIIFAEQRLAETDTEDNELQRIENNPDYIEDQTVQS